MMGYLTSEGRAPPLKKYIDFDEQQQYLQSMNKLTLLRLQKQEIDIQAHPIQNAIVKRVGDLDFHFCIYNLPHPYSGGFYHGVVQMHEDYPFQPPQIMMFTPSGRFQCGRPICTTFSSYHKQTWSIAWNLKTIIIGFISFMQEESSGLGSIKTSQAVSTKLANVSLKHNKQNLLFVELFKQSLSELGVSMLESEGAKVEGNEEQQDCKCKSSASTCKGRKRSLVVEASDRKNDADLDEMVQKEKKKEKKIFKMKKSDRPHLVREMMTRTRAKRVAADCGKIDVEQ